MADVHRDPYDWRQQEPLILTVPGFRNSGPDHWQSLWERKRADCHRVELGMWDAPHRNTWVNNLNLAIRRADRPVVLVAHSLGCLAVAWWAEYERPEFGVPVVGALFVAPPDVDRPGRDPRLAQFGAAPRHALPFPSLLVASQDDSYCNQNTARSLASDWGCRFVDAGAIGHINADSGLGEWPAGERLLDQLLHEHDLSIRRHDAPRRAALDAGLGANFQSSSRTVKL